MISLERCSGFEFFFNVRTDIKFTYFLYMSSKDYNWKSMRVFMKCWSMNKTCEYYQIYPILVESVNYNYLKMKEGATNETRQMYFKVIYDTPSGQVKMDDLYFLYGIFYI